MPETTPQESKNFRPPTSPSDDPEMKRDEIVTIRLSSDEREAWQAAADADQRKLADWIRIVVNAQLPAKPKQPTKKGGK